MMEKSGNLIFLMWSFCGTFFLRRKIVKALCARYARSARSAPRPAFGQPWRALHWDNGTLVDGIDKVLKKLHETDHDLILISDSHRVNVDDFLKKNHIFELFEELFCQPAGITDDGKYICILS